MYDSEKRKEKGTKVPFYAQRRVARSSEDRRGQTEVGGGRLRTGRADVTAGTCLLGLCVLGQGDSQVLFYSAGHVCCAP